MQGYDVRPGCPGKSSFLPINLRLKFGDPSADHTSRQLALGDCVDQPGRLAAGILQLALGLSAFTRSILRKPRPLFGKATTSGLDHRGVLELLTQAPEHRFLDQIKPTLALISAIS